MKFLIMIAVIFSFTAIAMGRNADLAYLDLGKDHEIISNKPMYLENNMTISCWAKIQKAGGDQKRYQHIISQWDDNGQKFVLGEHIDTGKIRVLVRGSDGISEKWYWTKSEFADDTWHMMGFTFADGDLKIFIDGSFVELENTLRDDKFTNLNSTPNSPLVLGAHQVPPTYRSDGAVDNCSIWSMAMDYRQILSLYSLGRHGDLKRHKLKRSLLHLWPITFRDMYDDTVSGNDFDLISGSAVITDQ